MSWNMPPPKRVLECVENWRGLDLRWAKDGEVEDRLRELIDDLGDYVTSNKRRRGIDTFFRVRTVDDAFPWVNQQDLLYPPVKIARRNRCNLPNESVLYCCPNPHTAIAETQPQGPFVLVKYRASGEWSLSQVVGRFDPNPAQGSPILQGEALLSAQILRDFIRSEFSKPVRPGTEFLYKISAALCRVWFDSDGDGWRYPSVVAPTEESVALKAKAVDRILEVEEAWHLEPVHQSNPKAYEARMLGEIDESGDWVSAKHAGRVFWANGRVQAIGART